ncbi:sporulation protein [Metabacillus sp. HB246100]|uniref:sporulation protein n=1 Tax=Bacillus weihaiensis TaxID=1547283 RepID=UPI0023550ED5|nr:sporulation protein [Bacillus weihaiensis]
MMLLRKYMSLLGVGSALIDLILPKSHYHKGELIKGHFLIKGGTIEQRLRRIECDLMRIDHKIEKETVVDTVTILSSKVIHSEETNHLHFTFQLPETLTPSSQSISYRFKTRLVFNEGVESKDLDIIYVH